MRLRHAITATVISAPLLLGACMSQDDAADMAKDMVKDAGIDLEGLGKELPGSFPAEQVPVPDLPLESAIGASPGQFVMRYTVSDPAADIAGYRAALQENGFRVRDAFDNLAKDGGNVGFTARKGAWELTAVAFGPGPADGNYMGIEVQRVRG